MRCSFKLLLSSFLLLLICKESSCRTDSLSISLNAKWSSTSILSEFSEYFASISSDHFWKFVNLLSNDEQFQKDIEKAILTPLQQFYIVSRLMSEMNLPKSFWQLADVSIASRVYSPAVEMQRQLALTMGQASKPCSDKSTSATNEYPATTWMILGEKKFCSCPSLESLISALPTTNNESINDDSVFRNDKIYSSVSDNPLPYVIVYANLLSPSAYCFHQILVEASQKGKVIYVFRHFSLPNSEKTKLSGYGVELAIKSTEYKAVDDTASKNQNENKSGEEDKKDKAVVEDEIQGFIFSTLRKNYPNLTKPLEAFRRHLLETESEIRPLKAWQFQDLSLQASYQVYDSFKHAPKQSMEPLNVLRDLSQNFPMRASALSHVTVTSEFRAGIENFQRTLENTHNIPRGSFYMTVNGRPISGTTDSFSLLNLIKGELQLMNSLNEIGLEGSDINSIIRTVLKNDQEDTSGFGLSSSNDDFVLDLRSAPIHWLNNLEKDSAYASWSTSLQSLLMPTYPGMMRRVARNLFNLVVFIDPSDTSTSLTREIVKYIEAFLIHTVPIRMGFIWTPTDNDNGVGVAVIQAFQYIQTETDGWSKAMDFLTSIHSKYENQPLTIDIVKETLKTSYKDADLDMIFTKDSDYAAGIKQGIEFIKSSGLGRSEIPHVLLNGRLIDRKTLRDSGFEDTVLSLVMQQTGYFQKAVYESDLRDSHNPFDWIMSQSNVIGRLNARLLQTSSTGGGSTATKYLTFGSGELSQAQITASTPESQITDFIAKNLHYLGKKDDEGSSLSKKSTSRRPVTIWLLVDLFTAQGRALVYEAMKAMKGGLSSSRIAILPYLNSQSDLSSGLFSSNHYQNQLNAVEIIRLLLTAVNHLPNTQARNFITKLVKEENYNENRTLDELSIGGMDLTTFQNQLEKSNFQQLIEIYSIFILKKLSIPTGRNAIVANGKIYGPLDLNEEFTSEDFKLLERLTMENMGKKLAENIKKENIASNENEISDFTMKISSIFQYYSSKEQGMLESMKRTFLSEIPEEWTIRYFGDFSLPTLEVLVIMDPLSREMQRISHMLLVLQQAFNSNIQIVFNPKLKHSEAPLKSFYRYVWSHTSILESADPSKENIVNPAAYFTRLPGQPLLTVAMDTAHSWMVEATNSWYDLDNLRLEDITLADGSRTVYAEFELEHLLLEGHCIDSTSGQPPRGLQFILGTKQNPNIYDTIVMANLGYFQLKANPGAWYLQLRDGKSKDIYNILSHEHTDSPPDSPQVVAVVENFLPKIIRVRVAKKPDKVNESVLAGVNDANEEDSIWSSLSNAFSSGKSTATVEKDEQINVFSLASGHLYERFLRIMMLSVLKNTKSKVKFWFLKNYLSPSFKQFIPRMAEEYGFEYELVQYKWPRWLHAQTEKQRIIWGYKILFLDVLFPLNVKKIIFVDADQTVRADLQELVDIDLEGAPYGYTPFCSSRTEMDGFRFWKQGYWAQHLSGRPYHISALYVVDLVRFRLLAAGDRLRGQYHGLSQDPNSLSNLDQDLPNNMIHQVPIKSLPQEWLWCETWCSDASKKSAKTIDLCNNPMTKEPKLTAAMRIIPEWKSYDQEVRKLWDSFYNISTSSATDTVDEEKIDSATEEKKDEKKTHDGSDL